MFGGNPGHMVTHLYLTVNNKSSTESFRVLRSIGGSNSVSRACVYTKWTVPVGFSPAIVALFSAKSVTVFAYHLTRPWETGKRLVWISCCWSITYLTHSINRASSLHRSLVFTIMITAVIVSLLLCSDSVLNVSYTHYPLGLMRWALILS